MASNTFTTPPDATDSLPPAVCGVQGYTEIDNGHLPGHRCRYVTR